MGLDASFADYVSARWSALYRLAVLLAGASHAEDLTQQALLRAFVSWNKVQAADSPDAYVKRILVNTAITAGKKRGATVQSTLHLAPERAVLSHEDSVVDREALWSRISVLPPRQRAVIVLRYYEDFSEAQIARTLGCATGTVKAHAAAALKTLRVSLVEAPERDVTGGGHG